MAARKYKKNVKVIPKLTQPLKTGEKKAIAEAYDKTEDRCIECGEYYSETKRHDDWIECIYCFEWLHEGCTDFPNACNTCGEV